jgi:hypothetical protein
MGLFSRRESDPVAWAALPSEPVEAGSVAEQLADAAPPDLGALGIRDLGASADGAGTVESIVIPIAPVIEIAQTQASGEDD